MKNKMLLIVIGTALWAISAAASSITYNQSVGTAFQTPGLVGNTSGAQMVGMDVWVDFSDGSTRHAKWTSTGSKQGAASVAEYFSISESDDSFYNGSWFLENLSSGLAVTGFRMSGVGGNTVFDRTFGGNYGTTGSQFGSDFNIIQPGYTATASYTDMLNLVGQPAVGDEFLGLQVTFSSNTPILPGTWVSFSQDTDTAVVSRTPNVPDAGSTAMLIGLAFLSLGAFKKRLG